MKVYLIFGHTGEYGDRVRWLVKKVFAKYESASEYVNLLNDTLFDLHCGYKIDDITSYIFFNENERIEDIMRKLEPDFRFDYTGTYYEIEEAELAD